MAPFSIKSFILYYIYAIYVWPAIRLRQARDASRKSVQLQSAQKQEHHRLKPPTNAHGAGHSIYRKRDLERETDEEEEDHEWCLKFGLVPKMPRLGELAYYSTSITHAYLIISGVLFRDRMIDTSGSRYYNYSCLLPKPMIIGLMNQKMTIELYTCLGLMHVVWRFSAMSALKDEFIFDMVKFVLADEEILEKVRIATEFGPEFVDNFDECLDRARFAILRDCLYYRLNADTDRGGQHERFVLRPNRTIEWHRKYRRYIWLVAGLSCTIFGLVGLGLILNGLDIGLFRQQIIYRGCDGLNEPLNPIYWLRIIGSIWVNLIALIDAYAGLVCAPSICFMMIFDLWVYWTYLEQQIDTARRQMPLIRAVEDSYLRQQWLAHKFYQPASAAAAAAGGGGGGHSTLEQPSRRPTTQMIAAHENQMIYRKRRATTILNSGGAGGGGLDATCAQIRASLIDFFHQLHRADGFVRCLTTLALAIWLLLNALFILTGLQFSIRIATANQLIVRSIQSLGFIVVTIICWPTLEMRRNLESVYIMLCSLMAYDSTNSRKNKWNKLLLYYMDRPRYSFTIFDGDRIFTRLIYGKILSFTVTFIFVLESLQLAELTFGTD